MNKYIRWGIIGTIAALAIFGGIIILTDDELDKAWYCPANTKIGIFENMSKTNVTGYWYIDGVRKQSTCTKSKWIPLREYCETQGIKNCGRIDSTATEDIYTGRYWCTDTCDPIVN